MNSVVETNIPSESVELDIVTEDSNFKTPESSINKYIM